MEKGVLWEGKRGSEGRRKGWGGEGERGSGGWRMGLWGKENSNLCPYLGNIFLVTVTFVNYFNEDLHIGLKETFTIF